jgi:hypothetical protein
VARRVCDLENLVNEEAIARVGLQRHVEKSLTVRNLSIKLYRIYICYTNITLYIAFGIIRGFT